jgi:ABC-2 type transport system ATP-binding protein
VIEVRSVSKRFGRVRALDDVSFDVPSRGIFGLIGPNGAGKTTLFRILAGLLAPDRGTVSVLGRPVRRGRPTVGQLSLLPQDASMREGRPVAAELVFLARLQGQPGVEARARVPTVLDRLGLGDLATREIGSLSHGQRRRVGVAQAMLGAREVVALDEPTSGVDPRSAIQLRESLVRLGEERCVLLSSHDLTEVESLCGQAVILHQGRVVASGTMDDLVGGSRTLQLKLSAASESLQRAREALMRLPLVSDVVEVGPRWKVQCRPGADMDAATSEVLRTLISTGVSVLDVERSRGLDQTFLRATD